MDLNVHSTIDAFANEFASIVELSHYLNRHLAIILNEDKNTHSFSLFRRANYFSSLPYSEQDDLFLKAKRTTTLKKVIREYQNQDFQNEQFMTILKNSVQRYENLKKILSLKRSSSQFLLELINECENKNSHSQNHEKLFDEILGFTNVELIEDNIKKSETQRPWEGASEGRYAYSSSLKRIQNFYHVCPPSSGDIVYDLGSGYGQVLFYGATKYPDVTFKGVEFVSERTTLAEKTLKEMNLKNLSFYAEDALHFNFEDGNIFYLYSPFSLPIKIQIFNRIVQIGKKKPIKVFVYDTDHVGIFENHREIFTKKETPYGNLFYT